MKDYLCNHPLMKRCLLLVLLSFLYVAQNQLKAQGCDTLPPVAVCTEYTVVAIGSDDPADCYGPAGPNGVPAALGPKQGAGVTTINALSFDDGSYDPCGNNILITIRRQAPYSNTIFGLNSTNGQAPCGDLFPDFPSEFERAIREDQTIKFYAGEVNTSQIAIMRVYKLAANGSIAVHPVTGQPLYSECLSYVDVEDKIKPTCTPPANVTVSCEQFDPTLAAYGLATATDNACVDTVLAAANYANFDTLCSKGTLLRTFTARDCSGNTSTCSQSVVVTYTQYFNVKFPDDVVTFEESPIGTYGEPTFDQTVCELLGTSFEDQVFPNGAGYTLYRTWSVINWCTFDPVQPFTQIPNPNPNPDELSPENFPGPIVSAPGTQAPWTSTVVKIDPLDPDPTDFSTFWLQNVNLYQYTQVIRIIDTFFVGLQGKVFSDTVANCSYQSGEPLLSGWTVKLTGLVTGDVKTVQTDANGEYLTQMNGLDTVVSVTLVTPGNFGQGCATVYNVNCVQGDYVTQDIPVHLEENCALMSVGMSTFRLRRCFDSRYYVETCNHSSATIQNAYVDVNLDNYLTFNAGSVPATSLGNNAYRFQLGDLDAGECRKIWIDVNVSCLAPLGVTHCSEAHVYPTDDCRDNSNWTGADVNVTSRCDGDSVRMRIANIGDGPMAGTLNFVVVEDIIMLQNGTFQLGEGESLELAYPANGSTWRLEAEEEPYHPFRGLQATAVEGCGGINQLGLVNLFPLSSSDPFIAIDCQENRGSFDPNDKQAIPEGYGSQHYIKPNTDIEYQIRFQNTGTDTAFNIVVLDTLSALLDPATVRVGTSSHPMEFGVEDGGILRFSFPNIMLPDSNINESTSHGFLKFRVSQKPNLPDNSVIENRAAIYFDFNDPVMTNTTFHTVREHFLLLSVDQPVNGKVEVMPNPTSGTARLQFDEFLENARMELRNQLGQLVREENFSGDQYSFDRRNLLSGMYIFHISDQNGKSYSGKIIVQ